jgi:nicotinamide-nucleotide adenylyltransferase
MASRVASVESQIPKLQSALQSFIASPAAFKIVNTISPTSTSPQPQTLFILDSSFNPPSKAHLALARRALASSNNSYPKPHRLLLLFSTHNATKVTSDTEFISRLAMMILFAEDLVDSLSSNEIAGTSSDTHEGSVAVDIGLTNTPYYTDKTAAIVNTEPPPYPTTPVHVHLVGYDNILRILDPKYYQDYHPPLSALATYFDAGHRFRITQRPADPADPTSDGFGTAEQQVQYVIALKEGSLENEGFQANWAGQLDLVSATEGVGISSTRVRKAVEEDEWDIVENLCTEGVAAWLAAGGLKAPQ